MYYLNLDKDNYLLSISNVGVSGPAIESIEEYDFSGHRLGAYYWNGTSLVLDEGRLSELTDESINERAMEKRLINNAMVQQEITAALLAAQINTLDVDDATALRWKDFYPEWKPKIDYPEGYKVQRSGKLYKAKPHTSQIGWEPENAPALWTGIDETHAGTLDDPIPYTGNMALMAGLYYTEDGVVYSCIRDTVNPVYHALRDLMGVYVETV